MPVNDLLGKRFFVPSYQRGYRWTHRQVIDLLSDLLEFQIASENQDKKSFYCLQPVVVKERPAGEWELVDGQQRLTTIFLILSFLKDLLKVFEKSSFQITFETRSETSGAFLQDINVSRKNDNIDFHHISNAYEAISKWFEGRDGNHRVKFLQCLLNDDQLGKNVKVIWYELPTIEDPVEAFTRLNVGKIPLTNAELIRALFLRSGNFEAAVASNLQSQIAQEWDTIEKALQSDPMWYFIHSGIETPPNRIGYVFQLIAKQHIGVTPYNSDPYATFHFYNERLAAKGSNAATEWLTVKQYFMTLEEWFTDRVLYHLVGFLVHQGEDLLTIYKAGKSTKKSAFRSWLKRRIFRRLFGNEPPSRWQREDMISVVSTQLAELEYGIHSQKIRSLLLLFNISTAVENLSSNLRFPFDSYKKEDWDIEHVRSVESGKPTRPEQRKLWLRQVEEYLSKIGESNTLVAQIRSFLEANRVDESVFDELYQSILTSFGEGDDKEVDNGIGNLTLLDSTTNRSYKNAVFPVKRRRILGLDRDGLFVPLCTKNVFLKCYSKNIPNMMFWTLEDRNDYRDAVKASLARFFGSETETSA
jgi:hypothetical protein